MNILECLGETWEPTTRAEWRSLALPHSGRPAEEAAVEPIPKGNQPCGGGWGSREGHQHGPASGSAALRLKREPRLTSGAYERYWGQAEAGSVLWRLPSHRGAGVHAPSEGQIPGGCADGDGTAAASPRQSGDRQAGENRVCQICQFYTCFFYFLSLSLVLCLTNFYFILFKGGIHKVAPDLDLVADVIEHIDRHGEPGNLQTTSHLLLFFYFLNSVFKMMALFKKNSFPSCFRCSVVFPPWMAGHQGRSRKTGGEAPFFLRLTDDLTMWESADRFT